MMIALPSASKTLRSPGESVTRVVTSVRLPTPLRFTTRFSRSPMWKGWFVTVLLLPKGPGSKWPPALVKPGSSQTPNS